MSASTAATFAAAGSLKRHIAAVHLSLQPHDCEHCSAAFTTASSLKAHVAAVHLGLKPQECELCSATFARASHMHVAAVHLDHRAMK